jgi:hypothetical protein
VRRVLSALAALAASALLLTGCQSGLSDTGEPLTIEQSELLAQTRFQVASRGEVVLEISALPEDDVSHLDLTVTLDPVEALAWGTMDRGPEGIAVTENVVISPQLFATDSSGSWQTASFDEGPSAALAVIFSLGADRPENAQLLRQSDARYLGDEEVGGETLSVFRLPSVDGVSSARTRMWLDADGRLRRLDAGDDEQLVILLTDAEPQPRPEGLEGGADG